MQCNDSFDHPYFNLSIDKQNIVLITPKAAVAKQQPVDPLLLLEKFGALLISLLDPAKGLKGIIYQSPFDLKADVFQPLFESAQAPDFSDRLARVSEWSATINQAKIPVVGIISSSLNSVQFAPMMWAHMVIAAPKVEFKFPDCSQGLFPAFGMTVYAVNRLPLDNAVKLLIKGACFDAQAALGVDLVDAVAGDDDLLLSTATHLLQALAQGTQPTRARANLSSVSRQQYTAAQLDQLLASAKKKAGTHFAGTNACFQVIEACNRLSLEEALAFEADNFTSVLQNQFSQAVMRTHYGVRQAKVPAGQSSAIQFNKIGIIGAGMMGSGIAFEVARSGMQAVLKDVSIDVAEKGKFYTTKICDKLIHLGKMTDTKKEAMEALIKPTASLADLQGTDCIIEAVFEQQDLKNKIIAESAPMVAQTGIFASNTTSLPISRLADSSPQPANFIGMHFFSPVDRMPLVEIILGEQTSQITLSKAKALALKLGKTPIVVHDSPAFFTSRIFFNYLLEALSMLLKGLPASIIEKQALEAGFAVSPFAVLDEISLPLMVHVYDQLPSLLDSQQRAYNFLTDLIKEGRTGRKSGQGFYDYDPKTGKKQLWPKIDMMSTKDAQLTDPFIIQKRLLHVMALESYRCLADGVLDSPIDGDIGSILGVGYAAHTGGVFAHMDQTELAQFVQDCDQFAKYGDQWLVPASLRELAAKNFTFYDGFQANWPLTKAK